MKRKKLSALVLSLVVFSGIISGCGEGKNNDSSNNDNC